MIASLSTNPEVTDRGRKRVLAVLAAGTLIIVAYWVILAVDRSVLASATRPAYFEFENAFPLADGWVAICLVGASVTLRARRPALFWLLTGGGAGVYLLCMDVLYDLQHGI